MLHFGKIPKNVGQNLANIGAVEGLDVGLDVGLGVGLGVGLDVAGGAQAWQAHKQVWTQPSQPSQPLGESIKASFVTLDISQSPSGWLKA